MTKATILLSTGERIERVIRDVDFMLLCDGRQYARTVAYDGKQITIARKRGEDGSEWHEMHIYTAAIERGASCWVATLDAESPLQALLDLRAFYPGCLIKDLDMGGEHTTIAGLYQGWQCAGPDLLDEALRA